MKELIELINMEGAPQAIGPYSQAVKVGNTLYVSGQLPICPEGGKMPDTIREQVKQAILNIESIVYALNTSLSSVVKTTVYLADLNDFEDMNAVYNEYFNEIKPARVTIQAARLPKDAKVEIDAIAYIQE